ncbi:replication initiation protein [Pseudoalteromonas luteoviolacea]|nr:RepB family plasmid replication initiator protein [Pseudoalteromonas luteoviolacea]MBQ4814047.1 replication initiation protein [Pseudoalteromonas luteoviolacea]
MNKNELEPIQSHQLNLDTFGLDPLLDKNYSNTLEIYDLAGKFTYDKHNKYLVSATAEETAFTRLTNYKDMELKVSVTAANIERTSNGKKQRTFVFPGAREEIIEDVLRKLATERRAEAYKATTGTNAGSKFVGIAFTLYEVYEELKRVGKSYSYSEIKEALHVLNRSILSIQSIDNSIDLSAPFFPFMVISEKGSNAEDTRSFVCFHPMVTDAILTLNFRRYNYTKALEFKRHYTRLTYKRLCHRWIQAAPGKPYTILLSTLINAMKDPYPNLFQDKALFKKVMEDLVNADVLERFEMSAKKEGKKITDWRFDLYASNAFAKQVAANNKVAKGLSS